MVLELNTGGYAFPGDCSVVIIAGEHIKHIDKALRTVEKMISFMRSTPKAMFVALEDSKDHGKIKFTSTKLPPLVNQ